MKQKLFSMLTMLAAFTTATAQKFSVEDVEALPGETVEFTLHMSEITAMTSMHFELVLPDGITAGNATPTSNWTSMFSSMEGRVSGISTTSDAFNGEGDILTMPLTVSASLPLGDYVIGFSEVRVNGNSIVTDATIIVHVVSVHHVTLDENNTTAPQKSNGNVNVTVKRTIADNEWSTICLPFDMTAEQTKAAFGSDVLIGDFKGYETTEDSYGEVVGITLKFDLTSDIARNCPYIIYVSQPVSEFTVEGVNVEPVDEPYVEYDNGMTGRQRIVMSTFMGTYKAGFSLAALCQEGYYPLLLNDGNFCYATEDTEPLKAYHAYFDLYDVLSSTENVDNRISISFDKDLPTGISSASANCQTGMVFDLQGRQVNNLQRGLYIKDGKKLISK